MNWRRYLPIIGIGIFLYILFKLNVLNILKEIVNVKLEFLLVAFLFVFIFLTTQTLKWFIIARAQMINIPFVEAFKINLIGFFYAFITPSTIGGAIRADYLRKYNNNHLGKGASNFVLDKILDLCSLTLLVTLSVIALANISIGYWYYFPIMFVLLLVFLMIVADKERSRKMFRIFYIKFVPEKIKKRTKQGFHSFYEDMPKKKEFVLFFLLNILNWIVLYTISFFVGLSLGINVSYLYFLAILPIATLVGHIPITINGIGTREAVMIWLFGLLGVGATKVFSMSVINLFIAGIAPSIIGSLLSFKDRK